MRLAKGAVYACGLNFHSAVKATLLPLLQLPRIGICHCCLFPNLDCPPNVNDTLFLPYNRRPKTAKPANLEDRASLSLFIQYVFQFVVGEHRSLSAAPSFLYYFAV